MLDSTQNFFDAAFLAFTPPSDLNLPDWCEKNIYLSELTCPEPGPLHLSRTPYVRGVLDAYASLYIEHIDLVWGRQLAKTTAMHCCLVYGIAEDPGPALVLFPEEKSGKSTSKNRIQTLINLCPPAAAKKTTNEDDFSLMEMKFKDSVLSIGWGGSGPQVMSRPERYLMIDEIDEFGEVVGAGLSSPVGSALETTSNFGNRKIMFTSTPSTLENYIWQDLGNCQYVFEQWLPCPYCGEYQILVWSQIKFPKEERDPEKVSLITWYECLHCQKHINNIQKITALSSGQWRARLVNAPVGAILRNEEISIKKTIGLYDVLGNPAVKKIGLHLPKWYSPFPNATFGHAAKEFLAAQGDYVKMRDWTKFWKAMPYTEKAVTQDYHELLKNKNDLPPLICPENTIALTCSVDPGQHGFWFTVLAWSADFSPHLVQYGFSPTWEALSIKCFQDTYEVKNKPGLRLPIWRAGVDTGGSIYEGEEYTMTEQAYIWLRQHQQSNLFGIKGDNKPRAGGSRIKISMIDRMPGRKGHQGQIIPGGLALCHVDTDSFKNAVHFHMQLAEDDPRGRLTFHNKIGNDLIDHILAEERQRDQKGIYKWVKVRTRSDLFVCLAYGFALADAECLGGIKVLSPPTAPDIPETENEPADWFGGIDTLI